jgi:hypothetical protein
MLQPRQLVAVLVPASGFIIVMLAITNAGADKPCTMGVHWMGCLLRSHENLAGGLIGASIAIIAALIAWNAVQAQISAHRTLALEDRNAALRLLDEDLDDQADGIAALMRILTSLGDHPSAEAKDRALCATQIVLQRVTRADHIKSLRRMLHDLPWDKRIHFGRLFDGLDMLRRNSEMFEDPLELLPDLQDLSIHFEMCVPKTQNHFEGLWRRTPKAMSFADWVRRAGGVD